MTPNTGDVGCLWSPTGDHLFQLVELETGGRRTSALADRCRYCGSFAFPVQRRGDESYDGLGRPAHS